ncbi:MAG: hypothetical protein ACKV2Q_32320 [Planctomycetaceae bacterium]
MRNKPCFHSRTWSVLAVTWLTLVGCGQPNNPAAPSGSAVTPTPVSSSPAAVPSDAECQQVATEFVAKLKAGDPSAMNQFLDIDALMERVTTGIDADASFRMNFIKGAKQSGLSALGQQITKAINEGGDYIYLRTHVTDGGKRVLFRLTLPGGGVNYHDMLMERQSNGQTKAVDMYVLLSAELISTTMRRAYLAGVAGQNRNLIERLTQGESEFVRNLPLFLEITQATQAGQHQKSLDAYQKLPDSLKRDKNFLMMRLQAAGNIGNDAVYQATMEDFVKYHPTDACIDMVSLDGLIIKKEYDKALAAIDRIDKAIGTDTYWEVMRGSVCVMAGRFPKAHEHLTAAELREPKSVELQWQFVSLSLQEQNFADTSKRLTKLRDEFGMQFGDLTKLPDYATFVKSPEYRAWLAAAPAR